MFTNYWRKGHQVELQKQMRPAGRIRVAYTTRKLNPKNPQKIMSNSAANGELTKLHTARAHSNVEKEEKSKTTHYIYQHTKHL